MTNYSGSNSTLRCMNVVSCMPLQLYSCHNLVKLIDINVPHLEYMQRTDARIHP